MVKSWKLLLAKFKFKMLVLMTFILKVRLVIYKVVNYCIQSKNILFDYSYTGKVTNLDFTFGLSYFSLHYSLVLNR